MKQLDFFFDFFSAARARQKVTQAGTSVMGKTLVVGGRREAQEVLFIRGHQIRVRRRAYQRNITMSLRPNGVIQVTAARSIPIKMITKFVNESWNWVEQQKKKFEEIRIKYPPKKFEPGEYFPVMGRDLCLKVQLTNQRRAHAAEIDGALVVSLPQGKVKSLPEALQLVKLEVRSFYEELGRKILSERLHIYSHKLQLFPQAVSYRCQKTRWGSCSGSGHISLNWRLAAAPLEVIDYVVIHELCHLKHPNHSSQFWKLVSEFSPRWKKVRRWLYDHQYSFDFLSDVSELHPMETDL